MATKATLYLGNSNTPVYSSLRPIELGYVTPQMFGAIADGVADDIVALEIASTYCMENRVKLLIPSGVYRITRQWVIGYKIIQEVDITYFSLGLAPSFNPDVIKVDKFPFQIEGSAGAVIFGDFVSNVDTAIIYYCILSQFITNYDYGLSIKNLQIKGVDYVNQIGLMVIQSYHSDIANISYTGVKYGLMTHQCYFSQFNNPIFKYCTTGWWDIGSNACTLNNIHADFCGLGFSFNQVNTLSINGMHEEQCEAGIVFNGSSQITMNGVYFESNQKITPAPIIQYIDCDSMEINGLVGAAAGNDTISPPYPRVQTIIAMNAACVRMTFANGNCFGNIIEECSPSEVTYRNFVLREGTIIN